jgi:hypothetical protein
MHRLETYDMKKAAQGRATPAHHTRARQLLSTLLQCCAVQYKWGCHVPSDEKLRCDVCSIPGLVLTPVVRIGLGGASSAFLSSLFDPLVSRWDDFFVSLYFPGERG